MDTAQTVVQHTVGVLILLWILGYTLLRAQEAWVNLHEDSGPVPESSAEASGGSTGRATFAYAQDRRRDGKLDAPLWGLAAGGKALISKIRSRQKDLVKGDGPEGPDSPGIPKVHWWQRFRPARDERPGGERRQRPGEEKWQPYDEDLPPEERARRYADGGGGSYVHADEDTYTTWWGSRRRRQHDGGERPRETPDITVEEVPRYGPRDPELERPIRALTPPQDDEEPVLAEVIRIDTRERTALVNNGTVAAIGQGGNQVAVLGDLHTHELAMAARRTINGANAAVVDILQHALAGITAQIAGVVQQIDSLAANGITGAAMSKMQDQLEILARARADVQRGLAGAIAGGEMGASVLATMGAHGNPLQEHVAAVGHANVADRTNYY